MVASLLAGTVAFQAVPAMAQNAVPRDRVEDHQRGRDDSRHERTDEQRRAEARREAVRREEIRREEISREELRREELRREQLRRAELSREAQLRRERVNQRYQYENRHAYWDAARYYRHDDARYRTRRLDRNDNIYRGSDNRYYCRRDDGTTGLIIGGISGGVLGALLAPGDWKTLGAIAGAGGGALIGRAIDRGDVVCR